jgi:phage baseplate assembly protein W
MKRIYNDKVLVKQEASVGLLGTERFIYKGFNSKNPEKNFKSYDIDLVKQDLINHFYIRKGEKLENPSFGTVIWDMLFEQFTEEVKNIIAKDVETIVNYDPRVSVSSVAVDSTDQGIRIEATVTYLQFNITEKMTFDFDRRNQVII